MDTFTLIKSLINIDYQLANNMYKETVSVYGQLSGAMITMPERTCYRLDTTQMATMYEMKINIIRSLYKIGVITDDGYKEYMLSEDPKFTPKIHLNLIKRKE